MPVCSTSVSQLTYLCRNLFVKTNGGLQFTHVSQSRFGVSDAGACRDGEPLSDAHDNDNSVYMSNLQNRMTAGATGSGYPEYPRRLESSFPARITAGAMSFLIDSGFSRWPGPTIARDPTRVRV